jgi:hypothetical protein
LRISRSTKRCCRTSFQKNASAALIIRQYLDNTSENRATPSRNIGALKRRVNWCRIYFVLRLCGGWFLQWP